MNKLPHISQRELLCVSCDCIFMSSIPNDCQERRHLLWAVAVVNELSGQYTLSGGLSRHLTADLTLASCFSVSQAETVGRSKTAA